jgi:hypothetical protein
MVAINKFFRNPKIFVIISKTRNNFFITGIDLFGRTIYKSSPGMAGFTGTDRVSKYAWYEASIDFFDGFVEYTKYLIKGKVPKKRSQISYYIKTKKDKKFNSLKKRYTVVKFKRMKKKRQLAKKERKRKIRKKMFRNFFIISKGISDFNLIMFIKAIKERKIPNLIEYYVGAINYPMKSFSLCRIKKVRRI